ncbi:MAG: hypothetical protein IJO50_01755, partial [Clostridia bacterium]|nr:hypothetical protein [Clostridia bacterium]
ALVSEKNKMTEQELVLLKSQRQSQRKAREKQMLLQEKRQQLDKSFALAKEVVLNLPLPKYEQFLAGLLGGEKGAAGELFLSERDYKRLEKSAFVKSLRHKNLRLSKEHLAEEGGFVIRRGKITVNRSLPALFSEKRASLEPNLAGILFEEGAR